jgi:hypothetical protein
MDHDYVYTLIQESQFINVTPKKSGHQGCDYKGGGGLLVYQKSCDNFNCPNKS